MSTLSKLYERVSTLESDLSELKDRRLQVHGDPGAIVDAIRRLERIIAIALPCPNLTHMQPHAWRVEGEGYVCHYCEARWPALE
jgi:hypothetical protein